MGRPKRMRDLLGVLKDQVSLIKATLLLSTKPTTSFHVAVLRATSHHPTDPPPDYTLDDVLSLGRHHRPTASSLVDAILRRLHRTQSAFVALKCLLTLHHILRRGSPILKAQFSSHHLNLADFRDASDSDTLELSKWVRWYAEVIEQSLIVSDMLGFYLCSPAALPNETQIQKTQPPKLLPSGMNNLLREFDLLVGMIERIRSSPDSLQFQRISMVYEVMKLVGEDYRFTLREIFARITEIGERVEELSDEEVEDLLNDLTRVEDCKEKMFLMFLNKKKNDGTWDSIAQTRRDVEWLKQRRENMSLAPSRGRDSRLVVPSGKIWLDVQWNPLMGRSV